MNNNISKIIKISSSYTKFEYKEISLLKLLEMSNINMRDVDDIKNDILNNIPIDNKNVYDIEKFAEIISENLFDYVGAIQMYLKILKHFPIISGIYRKLLDIYIYDLNSMIDFNFIENINRVDLDPFKLKKDGNNVVMSYTYIGNIYQKIGKFSLARKAFDNAIEYKEGFKDFKGTATYGLSELKFLSLINNIKLNKFSVSNNSVNKNILIGSIFFGKEYEKLLRDISCATFFCEENLKLINENWNAYFIIFCPLIDEVTLKSSDFYLKLSKKINIKIITIPEKLFSDFHKPDEGNKFHPSLPYSISGLVQTALVILAKKNNAALINMPPDAIFSNNTIEVIESATEKGFEIVLTPGVRLDREKIYQLVSKKYKINNVNEISIDSKSLGKLAFENLHESTKALFMTMPKITYPGMFFWPQDYGVIGHFLQMHPIYISNKIISDAPIVQFNSIDGDFLSIIIPDHNTWNDKIKILNDNTNIIMYELSGTNLIVDLAFNTEHFLSEGSQWIGKVLRPINYSIFQKSIYISEVDIENDLHQNNRNEFIQNLNSLEDKISYKHLENKENLKKITENEFAKLCDNSLILNEIISEVKVNSSFQVMFTVSVWGESYINNFLNMCLPSMISNGNLNYICENYEHAFLIYTEKEDIKQFLSDKNFQLLLGLINFEFIPIKANEYDNKYEVVNFSQSDSIQKCQKFDAIFFLYSDFVWSTGSMQFAINKIMEGYDGVISPVPPLILENFYEDLTLNTFSNESSYYSYEEYIKLSITPRQLVKFAKKNLHPMMVHNNLDNYPHSGNPAYLLWYGPDKNLLIRSLHIHPVILKVKHESPDFWKILEGTLDEWFLPFVYPSLEKLYVIKDSDELAIISLTPSDFPLAMISDTFKLDSRYIASWAENHAAPMQKSLIFNYTIWHDNDLKVGDWKDTIDRSERLAREVLFFLQMPDSVLEFEFQDLFLSRNARKIRLANKSARSNNATLNNLDINILLNNASFWSFSILFLRKFLAKNLNPKIKNFLKKFIK